MTRIAGINISDEKRVEIGLSYIYGIGPSNVINVLKQANVVGNPKFKDLTENELERLRQIIDKSFAVEGDLHQQVMQNIKRLKEIGSYRGSRHARNLPSRGQRTKTNSRTLRGNKRVTMGSGRRPSAQKT